MTSSDDDKPLDPAAEKLMAKLRARALVSGSIMAIGFAIVMGVIAYRLFFPQGSAASAGKTITATLPKGARIVSTAASDGRIVVTVDVGGTIELRTYDIKTLAPVGKLGFASEP